MSCKGGEPICVSSEHHDMSEPASPSSRLSVSERVLNLRISQAALLFLFSYY